MYFLKVSVDQASGSTLLGTFSRDHSQGCNRGVIVAAGISSPHGERTRFQAHSRGCQQSSSPCWLLAGDINSLPRGSIRRATSNTGAVFPERTRRRRVLIKKSWSFCYLVLDMTFHHSAPVLFIEVSHRSSPLTRGADYTSVWVLGGGDHWGPF